MWLYFLCIGGIVFLDQLTKWLVMTHMTLDETLPLIPDVLHVTYILNDGAAFGMLDNARWLFIAVSTVMIVAGLIYLFRVRPKSVLARVSWTLIIGGGLGNMVDRLFFGEGIGNGAVVDFIDFRAFPNLWHWIFNVADACVVVGTGLLVLYLILDIVRESRATSDGPAEKEKSESEDGKDDPTDGGTAD